MTKLTITFLTFISIFLNTAMGQAGNESTMVDNSIQDISTVAAIGAGGAILGLSTLSFVEDPKDHLKNVLIGGSIGIIIGVGVVAFKQASMSREEYINAQTKIEPLFDTADRVVWHKKNQGKLNKDIGQKFSQVQYNFSF